MDEYENRIRKLITPIFNKALKQAGKGEIQENKFKFRFLWRPNNYRRQILIKEHTELAKDRLLKRMKKTLGSSFNFDFSNKLGFAKEYRGVTIQYGRKYLTALYSQQMVKGQKQAYLIEDSNIDNVCKKISELNEEIKKGMDEALLSFARRFKLMIPYQKPAWSRYEEWLKGDYYIDNLPKDLIIHDTIFKKVYAKGIEFKSSEIEKSPGVHVKNYIKNRAIENVSPEISRELISLRETLEKKELRSASEIWAILKEVALHEKELAASLNVAVNLWMPKEKPKIDVDLLPATYIG